MDDEELDDETKGMKATLLLLFDGKLEPWPHQVKAVLRLEKERLMLLNKKKRGWYSEAAATDRTGQTLSRHDWCLSHRSWLECTNFVSVIGQ